jgi:hypothetical protein
MARARSCANAGPMTELRPNPIHSDTSRRGTAGAPAGEPGAARRRPARSVSCVLDEASPSIPPHEPCSPRTRKRSVTSVGLMWPPRGPLSRSRQAGHGAGAPLARRAHTSPARMKVGPLAQSRQTPGAEGRFTRFSAKRTGIRRHPRCLPSTSYPHEPRPACACDSSRSRGAAELSLCFAMWAGGSPQVVTSLWRIHGAPCSLVPVGWP